MNSSFLHRHRVLLLHICFWVLYFSYRVYDLHNFAGWKMAFNYISIPLAFNITSSYLHYFLVFPIWLKHKQVKKYVLFLTLLVFAIVFLRIVFENQVYPSILPASDYYKTVKLSRIISTVWDCMAFMLFTGMIRFSLDRFDLENKQKQLENEKLIAELNYLKAQINPHFLFNTLHNLNYLVYSHSPNATEVIIKLSNIMRYMIYDAKKTTVPLAREVDYMNDYIHLESIRLTNPVDLTFDKEGDFSSVEIAPLIFITLLENAFKHGVRDDAPHYWVRIKLRVDEKIIEFNIANKILPHDLTKLKSGFGLENLQKRLSLSYPGKYHLIVNKTEELYAVILQLNRQ